MSRFDITRMADGRWPPAVNETQLAPPSVRRVALPQRDALTRVDLHAPAVATVRHTGRQRRGVNANRLPELRRALKVTLELPFQFTAVSISPEPQAAPRPHILVGPANGRGGGHRRRAGRGWGDRRNRAVDRSGRWHHRDRARCSGN